MNYGVEVVKVHASRSENVYYYKMRNDFHTLNYSFAFPFFFCLNLFTWKYQVALHMKNMTEENIFWEHINRNQIDMILTKMISLSRYESKRFKLDLNQFLMTFSILENIHERIICCAKDSDGFSYRYICKVSFVNWFSFN